MKKLIHLINRKMLHKNSSSEKPVITISREKGSGGKPIAYLAAEQLGHPWKVYHQDTLEQIVVHEEEMNAWFKAQIDPATQVRVQQIIDDRIGERFNTLDQYYKDLITLLAAVGSRGNCIIVGRGAHFLFPDALKVRLICKQEQRIEWLMKYEHVSHNEAMGLIHDSDRQRENFTQGLFGHDQKIPHHYDIILKTSEQIKLEDAATTIVHLAKRRFGL